MILRNCRVRVGAYRACLSARVRRVALAALGVLGAQLPLDLRVEGADTSHLIERQVLNAAIQRARKSLRFVEAERQLSAAQLPSQRKIRE